MEHEKTEKGIFINGKKQIIEMLQFMDEAERKKLLQNIGARNAVMAKELSEQSFSFNDLVHTSTASLNKIFQSFNPAIIGLALYNTSSELQRKVLSSISRETAEAAFEVMSQNLSGKQAECKRAQEKVINNVIQLSRRQQIVI